MAESYVLFEHASGYALFNVDQFEEIAANLATVERTITDYGSFTGMVRLTSFSPFKDGIRALENANAISEGILHDDLQLFLEANLPKPGKKKKLTLGIADMKIGAAISDFMHISCQTGGAVPEITRGIRLHFPKLIKGLTSDLSAKAQLGLGHSYSRAKVKFNVNRVDNMIIQSIAILDQLDKDINTFAMRIREWYGYHFPELVRIIPDNYVYTRIVNIIGERKTLDEGKLGAIKEILEDDEKVNHIIEAARTSIGADIPEVDLHNVQTFCSRVTNLAEYRVKLHQYLRSKMQQCAPNLAALIGEQVGARLISHAGSLTNLAKFPASTVQILGAEKALFRALKTRGNTPKYGLIYHSSFIGKAKSKDKGRISRYLANKCSIATRLDCFSEIPSSIVGEHLRKQVEDRLKYIDGGENPRKNIDVMKEAVAEAESMRQAYLASFNKSEKKKKKKIKKEEVEQGENTDDPVQLASVEEEAVAVEGSFAPEKKKKKKKRDHSDLQQEVAEGDVVAEGEVTAELFPATAEEDAMDQSAPEDSGKKKKKKRLAANFPDLEA